MVTVVLPESGPGIRTPSVGSRVIHGAHRQTARTRFALRGAMERFYDLVAVISTDDALRLLLPEPDLDAARCDRCE